MDTRINRWYIFFRNYTTSDLVYEFVAAARTSRLKRGKIEGMDQRGSAQVIRAQVPLSEMFGYATDLRSRTQGRAVYTMQFNSYQEVPDSIAKEIVARVRGE